MLHVKIAPDDTVVVQTAAGFPAALDVLAARTAGDRGFLRAAWFDAAAAGSEGRTLVALGADGRPVAAIPTVPVGPPLVGARTVPGAYWPFRSILIDAHASEAQVAALLSDPLTAAALSPLWRLGPVYRDDPTTTLVKRAAAHAGWTVLTRPLGHSWMFDLAAMKADAAWPRKSTRRRLSNYRKALAQQGTVGFRFVTGDGWDAAVFDTLAQIEAASWVGKSTDGSGAKFLTEGQRALWHRAMRDPAIAAALSATILTVGDNPAAFSFDLQSGARQYSIASSYDDRFAAFRPGKIVTYHQLEAAYDRGVRTVDLGAGDSGYKREMGAVQGSAIIDLLIVRSRSAARVLRFRWGAESPVGREDAHVDRVASDSNGLLEALLTAGLIAATVALVE